MSGLLFNQYLHLQESRSQKEMRQFVNPRHQEFSIRRQA